MKHTDFTPDYTNLLQVLNNQRPGQSHIDTDEFYQTLYGFGVFPDNHMLYTCCL
jgi:hypothetical protein